MRTLQLTRSLTVTLAAGAGTVQAGPTHAGESWMPTQVSVSCSQAVTTGTCQASIYAGPVAAQAWFVDGTFSGDTGDTSSAIAGQVLYPGMYLFVVWAGGVSGATATALIGGTRTMP